MIVGNASRLVAVRVPFGPAFVDALEAVWAEGDAVLPIHPALPPAEVQQLLTTLRPAGVISPDGQHPLPDPAPVAAGTALVVPTSGTTGGPKGVELTHAGLQASARATAERIGAQPGDRWLCCVPPSHVAGLMVLVRARLAGTPPLVLPRFDPDAIARDRTTTLVSLVPTMLRRLLALGVDLRRFRCILLGGGPVPASLASEAQAAGATVVATYGMTETCGGVVYDGVPLPGVRLAVAGDGEIRLAGPTIMQGYRLMPAETAEVLRDGWFHTADAGVLDAGGRLTVLGRRDDLIVTGGEKVAPAEVEAVLARHPQVAEAAVTGRPDAEWGSIVVAVVVPAAGAATGEPALADLRAFVAQRLAAHKAPRALVLVASLPRGPTGKPIGLAALAAGAGAAPASGAQVGGVAGE